MKPFASLTMFAASLLVIPSSWSQSVQVDPALIGGTNVAKAGSSQGEAGQLRAQLVVTGTPDEVLKEWDSPAEKIELSSATRLRAGDPAYALIVVSGCTADKRNNCNVTASYLTKAPDGKTHTVATTEYLLKNFKVSDIPVLSAPHKLYFGKADSPGTYSIILRLWDANSDRGLELIHTLEINH